MSVQQTSKSNNCRETARNLLTLVSKLVNQAERTTDNGERRELYLRAMGISNEAYSLLGKARKYKGNTSSGVKKI